MSPTETNSGKTTGIVAYLTLVGCLIAITMNLEPKHEFARFHIRQAFGIHLTFHALAIFFAYANIPFAWVGLYVFYLVLWGYGFWGAIHVEKKLIPVMGAYFQKWFTFIQ